jgi:uncharacterized protein (TIGR02271 family)
MANRSNEAILTGIFRDRESAECAFKALSGRGYSKDDVNVMMSDETRDKHYGGGAGVETELGTKALEGAGAGSAIGGTAGAIIGAVLAAGTTLALPGLGLLVAGPIAGALMGAGAGGITGGLIGTLIGYGIPEERVKAYEAGIRAGGTVLSVRPRSAEDSAYLEERWKACGGEEVYSDAGAGYAAAADRTGREEGVIPVIEEQLSVGKREVEGGGVRVESRVEERPVEETVTLREERVRVDRRPVDRPVTDADVGAFKEGTIEISQAAEVPVVEKQARVVEEVVVGRDVREHDEMVRDTVRSTDVNVEQIGGMGDAGAYGTYEADFRNDFDANYAGAGRGYDSYAPAYRYGYDLANDPRYGSARDWSEVETGARRDWESRGQGAWEDVKASVRYAWDRVRGRASSRARG